ncbi:hypothetical protein [Paenibacillus polymyxa]|uniref:hypothetical protein n=1 Tax=Paenibacillus polymyxa TaxID=1406 RepID=UPI000427BE56|nr:hypothetical protein [Paenibacillus polymyxa]
MKINIHELFPRLEEQYTSEGVENIKEVAKIIEIMTKNLSADEINNFLTIMDGGNYSMVYDMFHYLEGQKSKTIDEL